MGSIKTAGIEVEFISIRLELLFTPKGDVPNTFEMAEQSADARSLEFPFSL